MAVLLSAASCLSWIATATGAVSEAALLEEIEATGVTGRRDDRVIFLPYLSGERTPHNDANATGVLVGLTHATTRADLARAVLAGVAFAFADGRDALLGAGADLREITVIGGGARSRLWGRILAAALRQTLVYRSGAELGPAFGAARLARLSVTGEDPVALCAAPPVAVVIEPDPALADYYAPRRERFRRLYRELREAQ